MGFIQQLISTIDRAPEARPVATTSDVLKYAPPRLRAARGDEDRLRQLEIENRRWRERAHSAEARLESIERSVQLIAEQVGVTRARNG